MKTGIYKPFVKDGELWGKEVNPYGEKPPQGLITETDECSKWCEAELSLQSFKVDEGEIMKLMKLESTILLEDRVQANYKLMDCTFRATLKDNKLINLEVL